MLTIKAPLALHSISEFGTLSDSLGEKIRGNYQIIGTQITGSDLLHMTVQEPDIYVGLENSGPFIVENNVHADNHIKLELVNQLINRIMLYGSAEFTYQDEVFVSSVLQKLGIADVNLFMRQMKLHMEKNELAVSLLNRYFESGRTVAEIANEFFEGGLYGAEEIESVKNEYLSEIHMHNEIFRRLMTAECNNTVYTYQNPVQTRQSTIKSFHDMELIGQADKLQLAQFNENMYFQESPVVFRDYLIYETEPLAPDELTRQKVTRRIDAAILENIINMASYKLQYDYNSRNVWKNYNRILYKSSENVLERFRYFQGDDVQAAPQIGRYTPHMNELVRDELRLVQMMEHAGSYDISGDDIMLYQDMRKSILSAILENQKLQKQLAGEALAVRHTEHGSKGGTFFHNVYPLLFLPGKDNAPAFEAGMETDKKSVAFVHVAVGAEAVGASGRELKGMAAQAAARPLAETGEADIFEIIRNFAASASESGVPPAENITLLELINSRNVHMKELLDSRPAAKDVFRNVIVDRAQARAAALAALENPEQVLREIYENGTAIERKIPNEIERILSITDERTRDYYERLMGYREADTGEFPDLTARPGGGGDAITAALGGGLARAADLEHMDVAKALAEAAEGVMHAGTEAGPEWQEQDMAHKSEPAEYEKARPLYKKEETQMRGRFLQFRKDVYELLDWIKAKEGEYRAYRKGTTEHMIEVVEEVQNDTLRELHRHRAVNSGADIEHINIEEIIAPGHMYAAPQGKVVTVQDVGKSVQMVHQTKEQLSGEVVEEVLETLQNSTFFKKNVDEKSEEAAVTHRQLQDIKNEIIRQSSEQFTSFLERGIKTQVHEISDMVYLEIERRLKNEQRRRGY